MSAESTDEIMGEMTLDGEMVDEQADAPVDEPVEEVDEPVDDEVDDQDDVPVDDDEDDADPVDDDSDDEPDETDEPADEPDDTPAASDPRIRELWVELMPELADAAVDLRHPKRRGTHVHTSAACPQVHRRPDDLDSSGGHDGSDASMAAKDRSND